MKLVAALATLLSASAAVAAVALLGQWPWREPASERLGPPVGLGVSGVSEIAVTRPARGSSRRTGGQTLRLLQAEPLGPGLYAVKASAVQAILDHPGQILAELSVTVQPMLWVAGTHHRVSSDAVDGDVTDEGFLVTDPKLFAGAGIEAGDTILSVGGFPVTALHAMVLALRRDPDRHTFVLEIDRRGARITQTYRVQ